MTVTRAIDASAVVGQPATMASTLSLMDSETITPEDPIGCVAALRQDALTPSITLSADEWAAVQ